MVSRCPQGSGKTLQAYLIRLHNQMTDSVSQNKKDKIVIAIDGPAASGKSTAAKLLAEKLGFVHLDSGALYRTLALAFMQKIEKNTKVPEESAKKIDPITLKCGFKVSGGRQINYIQDKNVSERIRAPEVTKYIRYIADNKICREWVNSALQSLAEEADLVVDGRDIGSVVFPHTPFKFFLDTDASIRSKRRRDELQKMGHNVSIENIKKEILKRDREDYNRTIGALQKPADAVVIQTETKSPQETVSQMLSHLNFSNLTLSKNKELTDSRCCKK